MKLMEAKEKYLNKTCDVYWGPTDREPRSGETISNSTEVIVSELYMNCYGEILFRCKNHLYTPFNINRLKNPR